MSIFRWEMLVRGPSPVCSVGGMLVGSPWAGMLGWRRRSRRGNWCGWLVDWGPTGAALMRRRQVMRGVDGRIGNTEGSVFIGHGRANWQHWGFSVHQARTGELATLRVQCSSGTDGRSDLTDTETEASVYERHVMTWRPESWWWGGLHGWKPEPRRWWCTGLLQWWDWSRSSGGVLDCYSDETGVAVVVVNWTATVMRLESQWMRERRTVGRPWASAELCMKTKLLSGEKYRHLIQEKAGYWEWASRGF